ncbi:MAG: class I mannose-6-phosphate isomerase [Clostridia bacterium]|nr:class I mannose-6-phosphate isomerase [Clostridia bacterium]
MIQREINWLFGIKPGTFRLESGTLPINNRDALRQKLQEAENALASQGCDSLRCEVDISDTEMIQFLEEYGMRRAGTGDNRVAYEKQLSDNCPLLPLRMHPAFRGGKLTPWGGERLKTVYGKDIAEVPTGESLEVSCIPGLESTDDSGVKLPELIRTYGVRFAGRFADGAFPLLLKIIDAAEPLSVQVHPDDAYAHDHENGKLGKTEAWLILDAPEGAELVYGIREGTDLATLKAACEQGAAVEPLLRRVKVKPGDVCYIPAGCVHAIGAGIMLYEIQQSSDITYRFYDWNRLDKNGKGRELHLKQALDVTDLTLAPEPVRAEDTPVARVLDKTFFTLDILNPREGAPVDVPKIEDFGLLTGLDGELTLRWENGSMPLCPGESLYIPCAAPALTIEGDGRAALSMPR